LHSRWTRNALNTGKHVQREKPFAANAAEAREITELANSDRIVLEAFHYRCHPLTLRVEQIIASGEPGKLKRLEAALCFPLPKFTEVRYNYSLTGGASMDAAGRFAVHTVRTSRGSPEVVSAQAIARLSGGLGHDGFALRRPETKPGGKHRMNLGTPSIKVTLASSRSVPQTDS
jgi:predicted dehydrogenase